MPSGKNRKIREKISQNDVTIARSYLEIDVMEWFSYNEIPFAYEAFVIPSVVGPSQNTWERMTSAIRALGNGNESGYENSSRGTPLEDISAFEALDTWNEIYDKHNLASEQVVIPVRESLSEFRKAMVLPDFALYPDVNIDDIDDDFDYSSYEYIVEVSGLWGVGLPGEATEEDWWDWYRVSAVAFKEYIYKLLGLWESVYWVIPNQPYIEGVSDGIPKEIRDDEHYSIVNTTSSRIELNKLEDALGITSKEVDGGLSPHIQPTTYSRMVNRSDLMNADIDELPKNVVDEYKRLLDDDGNFPTSDEIPTEDLPSELTSLFGDFTPIRWEYNHINMMNVGNNENVVIVDDGYVVYHGQLGEVYLSNNSVSVRQSQWKNNNMVLLREYVADVLGELEDSGIVKGLSRVSWYPSVLL